jgi:hypothetical protein
VRVASERCHLPLHRDAAKQKGERIRSPFHLALAIQIVKESSLRSLRGRPLMSRVVGTTTVMPMMPVMMFLGRSWRGLRRCFRLGVQNRRQRE